MWPDALAHLRRMHQAGGRVNYIGGPADSITDGFGATSRAHGWWSLFASRMASALGQPSRAIGSAEIASDSTWPVWTTTGPLPQPSGRSLGRHGMAIVRGTVASTAQPCDRVRLLIDHTTRAFGLDGGTLEIRIDGDAVARLDCGTDEVVGHLWDSGPLGSFATRRIDLECVDGGFVSLGHSYFHDGVDGDTGALFWRNAHARFLAGSSDFGFALPEATWAGALTTRPISHNPFNGRVIRGGGAISPDCFLCCTGTNDIGTLGNDRASIAATYEHLVDYIRQRCGAESSIGFVLPTASAKPGADQQALHDGILDACARTGTFMIDLWHELGSHGDDRSDFYFDGMHPNDRGHAAWADHVAAWMLEAVQPDVSASASASASGG